MSILIRLFLTFAKIGALGFGGGMAILALIYQSMQQFGNIDAAEFAELFAISQATPGPMAVNAATFSGFETAGIAGAAAATLGVVIPSFILINLCVKLLNRYREHNLVKGAFEGIRPAAVGMVLAGFVLIGETDIFSGSMEQSAGIWDFLTTVKPIPAAIMVISFILAKKFRLGSITIIIMMGCAGAILCS